MTGKYQWRKDRCRWPVRAMQRCARLALIAICISFTPAHAEGTSNTLEACQICKGFAERLSRSGGSPAFLASYEPAPDGQPLPKPLENVAFVYDNALVAVALVACGMQAPAQQIGEALLHASAKDRHFQDGRLRNAYAGGPIEDLSKPAALPGYWDEAAKVWREDAYQVGSATGSTAWGALALLTLHRASGDLRYLEAAKRVTLWIEKMTADNAGPGGYRGGFYGFEPKQHRIGWKSTEHNIDVYAINTWLAETTGETRWRTQAEKALVFVASAWWEEGSAFRIGTGPDGVTWNVDQFGLDAQLWPLIATKAFAGRAQRAMGSLLSNYGVDGGLDFNTDRDGVWTEGTAQGAAVLAALDRSSEAAKLLATASAQAAGDGLLYATSIDRLTTGLAIAPDSSNADFYYFRLPHIGATAWAALAAAGWNPFTGRPLALSGKEPPSCRPNS